jgi:hypothetical protein
MITNLYKNEKKQYLNILNENEYESLVRVSHNLPDYLEIDRNMNPDEIRDLFREIANMSINPNNPTQIVNKSDQFRKIYKYIVDLRARIQQTPGLQMDGYPTQYTDLGSLYVAFFRLYRANVADVANRDKLRLIHKIIYSTEIPIQIPGFVSTNITELINRPPIVINNVNVHYGDIVNVATIQNLDHANIEEYINIAKYISAIYFHNFSMSEGRMENNIHTNILPLYRKNIKDIKDEDMKKAYDEAIRTKELPFKKNMDISMLVQTIKLTWIIVRTTSILIPGKVTSYIFSSDKLSKLMDELIGIIAGLILGKKYLKKITEKYIVKGKKDRILIAPSHIDVDERKLEEKIDPLLDEMIDNLIQKPPTGVEIKKKEEEVGYSIFTDLDEDDIKREFAKIRDVKKMAKELKKPKVLVGGKWKKRKPKKKWRDKIKDKLTEKKPEDVTVIMDKSDDVYKKSVIRSGKIKSMQLLEQRDKVSEQVSTDPKHMGVTAGLLSEKYVKSSLGFRVRKKIHKRLCYLSAKTKLAASLFTSSANFMLAMLYIANKISDTALTQFMENKKFFPSSKTKSICQFVMPRVRAQQQFPQRPEKVGRKKR